MPDPLFRSAKRHALNLGITLKEFVTAAIERDLKNDRLVRRKRTVNAPFVHVSKDAPMLHMTPQELAELEAQEDARHFHELSR